MKDAGWAKQSRGELKKITDSLKRTFLPVMSYRKVAIEWPEMLMPGRQSDKWIHKKVTQ